MPEPRSKHVYTVARRNDVHRRRSGPYTLLGFLFAAGLLANLDRQFITVATEALHNDLGLSDVEIGLLGGPAFALFFAVAGVPLSFLVDRSNRVMLLGIALLCWSSATVACGFANSFSSLFIARSLVGIGEAVLQPVAYSLIGDFFVSRYVPRATAIFVAGLALGSGCAILTGGPLIDLLASLSIPGFFSWQLCFILFGLLGMPFALSLLVLLRDPRANGLARADQQGDPVESGKLFAFFWANRRLFVPLLATCCLLQMFQAGFLAWTPAFFMRTYGWSQAHTGLLLGVTMTISGVVAGPVAGLLCEYLERRHVNNALPRILLLSVTGLLTVVMVGALTSSWLVSYICFSLVPFFMNGQTAILTAVLVRGTSAAFRGRMTALFLFVMSVIGYGGGPVIYAFVTENVFSNRNDLYLSLATVSPAILVPVIVAIITLMAGGALRQRDRAAALPRA